MSDTDSDSELSDSELYHISERTVVIEAIPGAPIQEVKLESCLCHVENLLFLITPVLMLILLITTLSIIFFLPPKNTTLSPKDYWIKNG